MNLFQPVQSGKIELFFLPVPWNNPGICHPPAETRVSASLKLILTNLNRPSDEKILYELSHFTQVIIITFPNAVLVGYYIEFDLWISLMQEIGTVIIGCVESCRNYICDCSAARSVKNWDIQTDYLSGIACGVLFWFLDPVPLQQNP